VQTGTMFIVVVTVFDVPLTCPDADAATDVLFVPVVYPVLARTVIVTLVFAPGARVTELELSVEGDVNAVLFESVAARLKVVFVHADVSLFVMLTV